MAVDNDMWIQEALREEALIDASVITIREDNDMTTPAYGTEEEIPDEKSFNWMRLFLFVFGGIAVLCVLSAFVLWVIWSIVGGPIGITGWIIAAFGAMNIFAFFMLAAAESDDTKQKYKELHSAYRDEIRQKRDLEYKMQRQNDKVAEHERTIRTLRANQRAISVGPRTEFDTVDTRTY